MTVAARSLVCSVFLLASTGLAAAGDVAPHFHCTGKGGLIIEGSAGEGRKPNVTVTIGAQVSEFGADDSVAYVSFGPKDGVWTLIVDRTAPDATGYVEVYALPKTLRFKPMEGEDYEIRFAGRAWATHLGSKSARGVDVTCLVRKSV
ncbi:hypothetical protein [Prosthecodimorpha staleyi]|uniref:Uncharacterized protein n=1 Tax=Prosthecodimorpha staleyi TaxID=2840188 RepID=A0A947D117_9HYPH|nr:hypothetical protein [Prosthecodimorpha staleyi]MBT9288973.1 hypothetical protein [Prosthecodimorpha staleyi]